MIKILLVSNEENEFSKFESGGHAGQAAAGSDIVCSAVTVLLKTAVLSLISAEKSGSGLKIKVKAKTRGKLSAEVLSFSQEDKPRLRYLFEFLTMGLISVKE
ncbi:ribosomal-processing cysteine protease Prp, partial [Treponema pedis]